MGKGGVVEVGERGMVVGEKGGEKVIGDGEGW